MPDSIVPDGNVIIMRRIFERNLNDTSVKYSEVPIRGLFGIPHHIERQFIICINTDPHINTALRLDNGKPIVIKDSVLVTPMRYVGKSKPF